MSYRCDICNRIVPVNTPCRKVPIYRTIDDDATKDCPIGSIKREYNACTGCADAVDKGLNPVNLRNHYQRHPIHAAKVSLQVPNPPKPKEQRNGTIPALKVATSTPVNRTEVLGGKIKKRKRVYDPKVLKQMGPEPERIKLGKKKSKDQS